MLHPPNSKTREPEDLVEQAVHKGPMTGFYHRRRFLEVLTDRLDAGGSRSVASPARQKARQVSRARGTDRPDRQRRRARADRGTAPRAHAGQRLCTAGSAARFSRCSSSAARCATSKRGRGSQIARIAEQDLRGGAHNTLYVTCTIGLAEVGPSTERLGADHGSAALEPVGPRSGRQSRRAAANIETKHACSARRTQVRRSRPLVESSTGSRTCRSRA